MSFEIYNDIEYREFLVAKSNLYQSDVDVLEELCDYMGETLDNVYYNAVKSYYDSKKSNEYQESDSIINYMMNLV